MSNDGYFGLCPICHKTDGYTNAGRSHVFYCREHKLSWGGNVNIFSTWQFETRQQQRRTWQEIGLDTFQRVEPYYPPDTDRTEPSGTAHQGGASFDGYRAEDPFADSDGSRFAF